ncbi:MAG: orotidine-5'-phosphate decarboxylase [Promethearchaeia archaeon]
MFIKHLITAIREKKSAVCMGLDPRMEKKGQIPRFLIEEYQDPNAIILEFNKRLIDEVYDLIPIIKPQIAFYEMYDALDALKQTIKYAHKHDLLVLLDSKRNDIGSTSAAYAQSTFEVYGADACTLNAYFGIDGIKPYLTKYKNKGIYILVKTSNPSSRDFQDLFSIKMKQVNAKTIRYDAHSVRLERNYVKMAKLVKEWGKSMELVDNYHNLGAVVGATFPQVLEQIREIIPHSFLLLPGFGAQGAGAEDVKYGFHSNGLGALVNSSRGIMFAYQNKKQYSADQFHSAAREEILCMNKSINQYIDL